MATQDSSKMTADELRAKADGYDRQVEEMKEIGDTNAAIYFRRMAKSYRDEAAERK